MKKDEIKSKLNNERYKKARQIHRLEAKVLPVLSIRMSEISADLDDQQDIIMGEYDDRQNNIYKL